MHRRRDTLLPRDAECGGSSVATHLGIFRRDTRRLMLCLCYPVRGVSLKKIRVAAPAILSFTGPLCGLLPTLFS